MQITYLFLNSRWAAVLEYSSKLKQQPSDISETIRIYSSSFHDSELTSSDTWRFMHQIPCVQMMKCACSQKLMLESTILFSKAPLNSRGFFAFLQKDCFFFFFYKELQFFLLYITLASMLYEWYTKHILNRGEIPWSGYFPPSQPFSIYREIIISQ